MEFIDDDRPRFLFRSRTTPPPPPASTPPSSGDHRHLNTTPLFFRSVTTVASLLLISLSLLYVQSEPAKSLLLYLSLSLLVSPFAPPSLTGGDIRVGHGPIVHFPEDDETAEEKPQKKSNLSQKRSKSHLEPNPNPNYMHELVGDLGLSKEEVSKSCTSNGSASTPIPVHGPIGEKRERKDDSWNDEDEAMLRKLLVKHPAGKLKRWEVISAALDDRFSVESVIRKAKELADKKVTNGEDSYANFLKNRKPLDKRLISDDDAIDGMSEKGEEEKLKGGEWSSNEDIALLNALKAFPKETSMRWEKIAAAVPGRSKAECIKRVSELKRDFRSAKATKEG